MRLFVYGTLQISEILTALLDNVPKMTPATIKNYRAAQLKDRMFPGLVVSNNSETQGFILDLTEKEYKIIETWEDEKYVSHFFTSKELVASTEANENLNVKAFIWTDEELVLASNWNKEYFYNNYIDEYIERIKVYLRSN